MRYPFDRGSFLIAALLLLALLSPALAAQEDPAAEAERLNRRIGGLYQEGRIAEAIPLAQRVVELTKRSAGENHPDYALSLNDLATLLFLQGRPQEAEPIYKQSLAIREKSLGLDHPEVALSLNNLAELYRQQLRYAEAEPLFKRGLQINEKAFGNVHLRLVVGLNNFAMLYGDQGRYGQAESFYKRALEITEKARGPSHTETASILNNLAELYFKQGRYSEAEALFRKALAIGEKAYGTGHPEVATGLNNLAGVLLAQGKYVEAEPLYKRALAIEERVFGPQHANVATGLNGLAQLYSAEGRYAEAELLFKRSLAIREEAIGKGHPDVAVALNNLALLYCAQGKPREAEPLYRRSLAIREKALGATHPAVATVLNNLAVLYRDLGQFAAAEPLYERSLAIREKALGPAHPDVGVSLGNLAEIYHQQGRYAEAEPLYRRSLAIREKALGRDHPDVAESLNNLAGLLRRVGQLSGAEAHYQRSLAIREKALGADHPDVASNMNNIAVLYHAQGRYTEAKNLFDRALAIKEKAFGPAHPDVTGALTNSAALSYALGRPAEAGPLFDRVVENLSRQFAYNFTFMSEKDRLQFLDTVSSFFPLYYSFCLSSREVLPGLAGRMYDVLLWQKGLVAQSVAALRAKILAGGDAEALRLLDRLTEKKNEIAKLASAAAEPDPMRRTALGKKIEALEREANDLEKKLTARSAALGEMQQLARITWQRLRDGLGPDEAAVEIARFPYHDGMRWTEKNYYVALVLRRDSREPAFIILGEQQELERIPMRDYRRLVAEPGPSRPAGLGRRFYSAFWLPLEPHLGTASRVYLSADGELNQVSFGPVPTSDERLLMEAYDLRIVNSTKDLLREAASAAWGTAVLIGNPKFAMSETELRAVVRPVPPGDREYAAAVAAPGESGRRSPALSGAALKELQGTQQEVQDISEALRKEGWQIRLFTGGEAIEERVKGVLRPRVLHLATHGFFEPDRKTPLEGRDVRIAENLASIVEDPMLRSGIYLAGADRVLKGTALAADLEDGVLTAYEASQLDLQGTELVVLSACETGLGETAAGEGVFGLRRALQVAGAEAVLMSLWAVPDEETRELMTLFYGNWLAGKSKNEALREAQLEVREKVRARYGEDLPLFWGAFVLIGR